MTFIISHLAHRSLRHPALETIEWSDYYQVTLAPSLWSPSQRERGDEKLDGMRVKNGFTASGKCGRHKATAQHWQSGYSIAEAI